VPYAVAEENPESRGAEDHPKEQEPQLEAGEAKEKDADPVQSRVVSESMATVIASIRAASSPAATSTP
jgi:hypothetical protein